jgi:hypothetical protein
MKTIVYQSYQPVNTPKFKSPAWIETCMETVKDWAYLKGFEYQRKDNFFDYVPDWYKDKVDGKLNLVADLARLELAKEFLAEGYDRTIWVDADVVIFAPNLLNIETTTEYLLCREVWLDLEEGESLEGGQIDCSNRVTNAWLLFTQNNSFLDFYIYACKEIIKNKTGRISRIDVSTRFLTRLYQLMELPFFENMGLFSPITMYGIIHNKEYLTKSYMREFGLPIYAANLCMSFRNINHRGITMTDEMYEKLIDKLLKTKGEVINKYISPLETSNYLNLTPEKFEQHL